MAQLFPRRVNTIFCASIGAILVLVMILGWSVWAVYLSPYTTRAFVPLEQPVPFSHQHHVGELGIDCRYCHNSVETAASAGIPATEVCMTCHSQIWNDAPALEPVRESFQTGQPVRWTRVHDLPEFVYFNHSIHINKGIGCADCHGRVDQMPITYKARDLYMKSCLECHRHPEMRVRPRTQVFDLNWTSAAPEENGQNLVRAYGIQTDQMTDCSICHR